MNQKQHYLLFLFSLELKKTDVGPYFQKMGIRGCAPNNLGITLLNSPQESFIPGCWIQEERSLETVDHLFTLVGVWPYSQHVFWRFGEAISPCLPRDFWGRTGYGGSRCRPSGPWMTKVRAVSISLAQSQNMFPVGVGICQDCHLFPEQKELMADEFAHDHLYLLLFFHTTAELNLNTGCYYRLSFEFPH